jgi:hypothetical protein
MGGAIDQDYEYSVALNGNTFWQNTFNSHTDDRPPQWALSLADFLPDQVNTLTIQRSGGEGSLLLLNATSIELSSE